MNGSLVLASDLGSGGCKTMLLDVGGACLAQAQQEYPTYYPQPEWAEQNPEDWYEAFCITTRKVLQESGVSSHDIAGVGIVGVTHNTVLLDTQDRPLCRSILLFDNRSVTQVDSILTRWGDLVSAKTLNDITPVWTYPQLMWLRDNQPHIWRATRRLLFQKDYVRHRLAHSYTTDYIDAGGTLLFDPVRGEWISEFCDDLGIQPDWLPQIARPTMLVSEVGIRGAEDTGLRAGTPVITGTTDTVAEVLGTGATRSGRACIKLASVGRIAVTSEHPIRKPHILNYRHVLEPLWYPGTASKYAASAFRWLREVLWSEVQDKNVYQQMDEAAKQIPMGSDGLIFQPHLMGEWAPHWDEKLRANFLGLTVRHGRDHLTRAALEGVAFALRDALSEMEQQGLVAQDIRLIGQGAKSPLWRQIVADVLNRPLSIPMQTDAVYGAALITAMGVGLIEPTAQALDHLIQMQGYIEPNPHAAQIYETLFGIYQEADRVLQPIASRLHYFTANYGKDNQP